MKLIIRESGRELGHRIVTADSFLRRFRGLMLTDTLPEGSGLHLQPCRSVHSFFMKFPIDVLHLDESSRIVGMEHRLKPGHIGETFRGTRTVVELPAGTLEQAGALVGQTAVYESNAASI